MWQWQDKLCQYTKIFLQVIFQNFDSFFMYLRCFARESVSFRSAVLSLAGGLQPLLCYWPTPDNHAWTPVKTLSVHAWIDFRRHCKNKQELFCQKPSLNVIRNLSNICCGKHIFQLYSKNVKINIFNRINDKHAWTLILASTPEIGSGVHAR